MLNLLLHILVHVAGTHTSMTNVTLVYMYFPFPTHTHPQTTVTHSSVLCAVIHLSYHFPESEGLDGFTLRDHSGTESDEEVQSKARAKTRARGGTGKAKGRI